MLSYSSKDESEPSRLQQNGRIRAQDEVDVEGKAESLDLAEKLRQAQEGKGNGQATCTDEFVRQDDVRIDHAKLETVYIAENNSIQPADMVWRVEKTEALKEMRGLNCSHMAMEAWQCRSHILPGESQSVLLSFKQTTSQMQPSLEIQPDIEYIRIKAEARKGHGEQVDGNPYIVFQDKIKLCDDDLPMVWLLENKTQTDQVRTSQTWFKNELIGTDLQANRNDSRQESEGDVTYALTVAPGETFIAALVESGVTQKQTELNYRMANIDFPDLVKDAYDTLHRVIGNHVNSNENAKPSDIDQTLMEYKDIKPQDSDQPSVYIVENNSKDKIFHVEYQWLKTKGWKIEGINCEDVIQDECLLNMKKPISNNECCIKCQDKISPNQQYSIAILKDGIETNNLPNEPKGIFFAEKLTAI